jgi:hypothetical protein
VNKEHRALRIALVPGSVAADKVGEETDDLIGLGLPGQIGKQPRGLGDRIGHLAVEDRVGSVAEQPGSPPRVGHRDQADRLSEFTVGQGRLAGQEVDAAAGREHTGTAVVRQADCPVQLAAAERGFRGLGQAAEPEGRIGG